MSQVEQKVKQSPKSDEEGNIIAQKYARFTEQFPQLGRHLLAVDRLGSFKGALKLNNFKREALLVYSLWTEDPVAAIEIAESAGLSEERVNQYVELASSHMSHISDALLGVVDDLRKRAEQVQTGIEKAAISEPVTIRKTAQSDTAVEPSAIAVPQDQLAAPTPRMIVYAEDKQTPTFGTLAQTYDHPIPTREQEALLFEYLERGSTLEVLIQDERLNTSIEIKDLASWGKVLAESKTVQDVIINTTLRFTDVIARAYQGSGIPHQDLVNAGNIGAMKALQRYDPSGPARFVGYAKYAIRNEIAKAVRDAESIRIPARIKGDLGKVFWVKDAFRAVLGKDPTIEELRSQLLANTNLSVSRIDDALENMQSKTQYVDSIHRTITPDSEDEVADFIPDKTVDIEGEIIATESRQELKEEVHRALHKYLTERERRVVIELFGIGDGVVKSPEAVAQATGLMQDTIDIIKERALARLRYDERLKAHWDGKTDIPSFVYHLSAERAAFRLGLFSGYTAAEAKTLESAARQETAVELIATSETESLQNRDAKPHIGTMGASQLQGIYLEVQVLRDQGLNENEIAERLGKSVSTIRIYTSNLELAERLKTSNKPEQARKENTIIARVKQLRNEGYNNKQISEMLHVSHGVVAGAAVRLLKGGEITPHKPFGNGITRREKAKREKTDASEWNSRTTGEKIIVLLNQGLTRQEVADRLGIKTSTVTAKLSKIRQNGDIGMQPRSVGHADTIDDQLKELYKQGRSYSEMARVVLRSPATINAHIRKLIALGELEPFKIVTREDLKQAAISDETALVGKYLEEHPRPTYQDGFRRIFGARYRKRTPEIIEFENLVRELRLQGLSNMQIAEQLNETVTRVGDVASDLVKQGAINPLKSPYDPNFDVQVLNLRLQGLTYEDIAGQLGTNREKVSKATKRLIKKGIVHSKRGNERVGRRGRVSNRAEFDRKVKELMGQGFIRAKIAEQLGVPLSTIDSSVHRMIILGEYTPGRITSSKSVEKRGKYYEKCERIKKLFQEGLNILEVASAVEDSLERAQVITRRLIKEGKINPSFEQLKPAGRTGYVDKNASIPTGKLQEVYQRVAEMRNKGLGNQEIATTLNLSVHRVEMYASQLIRAGVIQPILFKAGNHRTVIADLNPENRSPFMSKADILASIATLRNQGLGNTEIARQLSQPINRINNLSKSLIKSGVIKPLKHLTPFDEVADQRSRVAELRNKGFKNEEIAVQLSLPIGKVNQLASQLIIAGQIQPSRAKRLPQEEKAELSLQVVQLQSRGLSISQIASELGQPVERIKKISKKLHRSNRTKDENQISEDDKVGETVETQVISSGIDTQPKPEVDPRIQPRNDSIQTETDRSDSPIKAPKGAKPFYTVKDIAKELEVPAHVVNEILKEIGVTRAKSSWRLTSSNVSSKKKVPLHFTYGEYLIVRERVQRGNSRS